MKKDNDFLAKLKDVVNDMIKNPKKLLPTIILAAVWMLFSIISVVGANIPVLRFLYTLTYANGGMFGGFFGAIGGIFGKAVFAAVVNSLVLSITAKQNPLKGFKGKLTGVFTDGLKALWPFLMGGGAGIILYFLFNITSSLQNCAISVACAIAGAQALTKQNGLVYSAVFYVAKKASKGKAPSQITVTRILAGLTAGFAISLPITFLRLPWLIAVLGILVLAAGIVLPMVLNKKQALAVFILFIMVFSLFGLDEISVRAEDYESEVEYVPYRGRLSYTNGRRNKYGQPFPDLMDFDNDGSITWFDMNVQKELSHDPDWLDRPLHPQMGVLLAILTGMGGAAMGAVGGALGAVAGTAGSTVAEVAAQAAENVAEAAGNAAQNAGETIKDFFDNNKYIKKDEAGDLTVTDPATGETFTYVSNGDGTYTNPVTGSTSDAEGFEEWIGFRERNADTLKQDADARDRALAQQNADNQGKSWLTQKLEDEKHQEEAKAKQEEKHDAYVDKLKDKYSITSEDRLYQKIGEEQGKAEIERYEQFELEEEYKNKQEYVENVKTAADTAIDVLAEIEPTGAGSKIKDAYTVGTAAASNAGEVMAGEKTVGAALVQTVVDSGVGLAKNHADDFDFTGTGGYAEKAFVNITGDGVAATTNELLKGKSLEEAQKAGSNAAKQAGVNFVVDSAFDAAGAKFGSDSKEVAGKFLGSEVTKGALSDGAKAGLADMTKNKLTFSDPDEAAHEKLREQQAQAEKDAWEAQKKSFEESKKNWKGNKDNNE